MNSGNNHQLANWLVTCGHFDRTQMSSYLQYCQSNDLNLADQLLQHQKITQEVLTQFRNSETQLSSNSSALRHRSGLRKPTTTQATKNQLINGWKLTEKLGEGGMGAAWIAVNPEFPGATRVIKLILNANATAEERFSREAQAIAKVSQHRNIVTIHDFGEAAGQSFIMMEHIEGQTLEELLDQSPDISEKQICLLLAQVARALHFIHSRDMIHRDLKPANIMIRETGEPVLLDFGLALQFDLETLTLSQQALGTPHYMAPEQIAGERSNYGPGTDIFALGVILYQCLTGIKPFNATQTQQLIAQITAVEPEPPNRIDNTISSGAAEICMKALQKSPAHRHKTAEEFAQCLESVANDNYESAKPRSLKFFKVTLVLALIAIFTLAFLKFVQPNFHRMVYGYPSKSEQQLTKEQRHAAKRLIRQFETNPQVSDISEKQAEQFLKNAGFRAFVITPSSQLKERIFHEYIFNAITKPGLHPYLVKLCQQKTPLATAIQDCLSTVNNLQSNLDTNNDSLNQCKQHALKYQFEPLAELFDVFVHLRNGELPSDSEQTSTSATQSTNNISPQDRQKLVQAFSARLPEIWSKSLYKHFQQKKDVNKKIISAIRYYQQNVDSGAPFFSSVFVEALPYPPLLELIDYLRSLVKQGVLQQQQVPLIYSLYGLTPQFADDFVTMYNKLRTAKSERVRDIPEFLAALKRTLSCTDWPNLNTNLVGVGPNTTKIQQRLDAAIGMADCHPNFQLVNIIRLGTCNNNACSIVVVSNEQQRRLHNQLEKIHAKFQTHCDSPAHKKAATRHHNALLTFISLYTNYPKKQLEQAVTEHFQGTTTKTEAITIDASALEPGAQSTIPWFQPELVLSLTDSTFPDYAFEIAASNYLPLLAHSIEVELKANDYPSMSDYRALNPGLNNKQSATEKEVFKIIGRLLTIRCYLSDRHFVSLQKLIKVTDDSRILARLYNLLFTPITAKKVATPLFQQACESLKAEMHRRFNGLTRLNFAENPVIFKFALQILIADRFTNSDIAKKQIHKVDWFFKRRDKILNSRAEVYLSPDLYRTCKGLFPSYNLVNLKLAGHEFLLNAEKIYQHAADFDAYDSTLSITMTGLQSKGMDLRRALNFIETRFALYPNSPAKRDFELSNDMVNLVKNRNRPPLSRRFFRLVCKSDIERADFITIHNCAKYYINVLTLLKKRRELQQLCAPEIKKKHPKLAAQAQKALARLRNRTK